MSTMLEQALVDASALKEAALKNAESAILEKYAAEVKNTIDTLLEVDEFDLGMGLDAGPDPIEDKIPLGGTEGETACPCPDEKQTVSFEFNLADLEQTLQDLGPEEIGEPLESSEELAGAFGAEPGGEDIPGALPPEEEDEELPLELQEDIEIDEELLFEYPDPVEEEKADISETEDLNEDDEIVLPEGC